MASLAQQVADLERKNAELARTLTDIKKHYSDTGYKDYNRGFEAGVRSRDYLKDKVSELTAQLAAAQANAPVIGWPLTNPEGFKFRVGQEVEKTRGDYYVIGKVLARYWAGWGDKLPTRFYVVQDVHGVQYILREKQLTTYSST